MVFEPVGLFVGFVAVRFGAFEGFGEEEGGGGAGEGCACAGCLGCR